VTLKIRQGCPVQAAVNVIAGKWKVNILWHLSFGAKRFAEIRNVLKGISEKVLTAQLRQLENDGVIRRDVENSVPPKVSYSLTRPGKDLVTELEKLCRWGSRHFGIAPTLIRPKTSRSAAAQTR
jgi:DNA-binding HxlR family transcriptional regulator